MMRFKNSASPPSWTTAMTWRRPPAGSSGAYAKRNAGWLPGWSLASFVVLIVLTAYHIGTPVNTAILGRGGSFFLISPALVASLVLMPFAVDGFLVLMLHRLGKYCLLALTAVVVWILIGAFAAPPLTPRDLVNPVGSLAIMCGAASLFWRFWPSIGGKLPLIIVMVVGAFMLWLAFMSGTGQFEVVSLDLESEVTRYSITGVRPTEVALYLVPQLCYLLFLVRFPNRYRWLAGGLAAVVFCLIVFVTGSRGAIAATGIVFCLFALSRASGRKSRFFLVAVVIALFASGVLTPYIQSMQRKAHAILSSDEQEDTRTKLYSDLFRLAKENPLFGIGLGNYIAEQEVFARSKVPHHNLLGRACENGFPVAGFYAIFVLVTIRALWMRRAHGREPPSVVQARFFISACLWIFLVQQFRGLFTDTWTMKEIYFVAGAGLGLRAWLESQVGHRATKGLAIR